MWSRGPAARWCGNVAMSIEVSGTAVRVERRLRFCDTTIFEWCGVCRVRAASRNRRERCWKDRDVIDSIPFRQFPSLRGFLFTGAADWWACRRISVRAVISRRSGRCGKWQLAKICVRCWTAYDESAQLRALPNVRKMSLDTMVGTARALVSEVVRQEIIKSQIRDCEKCVFLKILMCWNIDWRRLTDNLFQYFNYFNNATNYIDDIIMNVDQVSLDAFETVQIGNKAP